MPAPDLAVGLRVVHPPVLGRMRKDINPDFPLRGFVLCNDCNNRLTANWSKSKTGKKHPCYLCFTKGCASHRKSIRRDVLEQAFASWLSVTQ
jgi:hypothetical protein